MFIILAMIFYLILLQYTNNMSSDADPMEVKYNQPPEVEMLYPTGGEQLTGVVMILWRAEDPDGDPLNITIQYTQDPEPFCPACPPQKWHDIAVNISNTRRFQWDTTLVRDGEYMLKIIASDGDRIFEDRSGWVIITNEYG
jgi:hypothetical protein